VKPTVAALFVLAFAGCLDRLGSARADRLTVSGARPDVPPAMLNDESPFRYPNALWAQRVQGNVTLRLFIDSTGRPVRDSTTVATSSGVAAFDSAALAGAGLLRFRPALLKGVAVSVALLLPVFFRHPDAPALPGDSVIKREHTPAPAP